MIDEQDLIIAPDLSGRGAAAFATRSADFEQVGKVVLEQDRELQVDGAIAVIAHAEPLIGRIAPQEDRAQNVNSVLFQDEVLAGEEIGIGKIDEERRIVVAQIGAKQ